MKSMTGFGRSEREASFGKIILEIQSVNRKYFELYVSLPKEFARFENDVRKKVGEKVQRGLLSIRIHLFPNASAIESLLPDPKLLQSMQKGWESLADSLGYEKRSVDFAFLIEHFAEVSHLKLADEREFASIAECLDEAIQRLDAMKSTEGKALAKDISLRLKDMEKKLGEIEGAAPDAVEKLRRKLKERMEEIFAPGSSLDERLLREVALFAERVDISEEITRMRSHLSQFDKLLQSKEWPSGRKMDFLVQEMGRETNTIGSKSMDGKISYLVVDIKAELEKVREQIQNIE